MTAPTLTPSPEREDARSPRRRPSPRRLATSVGVGARALVLRARGIGSSGASSRPWLVGPFAAAWSAAIGLAVAIVPLLAVWMATPQSGLTWLESLRVSGLLWLVAHGAPIAVSVTTYSLVPWGLALVPILLLAYAGGWAARRCAVEGLRDLLQLVISAVVTYAVIAGVIAAVTSRPASWVSPVSGVLFATVVALLSFGFGAVRGSTAEVGSLLPTWLLVPVRSGLVGAFAILGFGAVAATAALLVHVDDAVTMAQSLHAGVWGGLALLLLGIAYVPVLLVWASSYVLGAGVVIGPAVAVSPFIPVTAPTQLPPFPMLAAVPQAASPLAWALPIAGVVAGVLVGLSVARGARTEPRLVRLALATGAAAVTGVVMTGLAYLASGSLGDLRLANLGPPALMVGVLAFVLVTLGAVPSAVVASSPAKPQLTVPRPVVDPPADDVDCPPDA